MQLPIRHLLQTQGHGRAMACEGSCRGCNMAEAVIMREMPDQGREDIASVGG
jgi:hypothetical protein